MTENRTYTEADVAGLRREWEREERERGITHELAELRGRLAELPGQMRSVAREVVTEVLAEQRTQQVREREERTERAWRRTPVVAQLLQLAVAGAAFAAGLLIHRVGIP